VADVLRVGIHLLRRLCSYSLAITSRMSPKPFQDFVLQVSGPISPFDYSPLVARS
jgi:hypothetical protein